MQVVNWHRKPIANDIAERLANKITVSADKLNIIISLTEINYIM